MTGTRPATSSTVARTTSMCSAGVSEYNSPVPPAATTAHTGWSINASRLRRSPAMSSERSAWNGVTGNATTPARRRMSAFIACDSYQKKRGPPRGGPLCPFEVRSLEAEARRAHQDARVARGRGLAEGRVHLVPRRVEARRRVDRAELRVVQDVVALEPQLQPALAGRTHREVLEYGQVPVVDPGQAEDVAGRVPVLASHGARERADVQPVPGRVRCRAPVARRHRVAGDDRAHHRDAVEGGAVAAAAAREIEVVGGGQA